MKIVFNMNYPDDKFYGIFDDGNKPFSVKKTNMISIPVNKIGIEWEIEFKNPKFESSFYQMIFKLACKNIRDVEEYINDIS